MFEEESDIGLLAAWGRWLDENLMVSSAGRHRFLKRVSRRIRVTRFILKKVKQVPLPSARAVIQRSLF
ncbi:MAG: hypothetical protein HQK96_13515 [Nitrospirae bacterium]|nr:hypothetical protein [Nitrospirota bacterium]